MQEVVNRGGFDAIQREDPRLLTAASDAVAAWRFERKCSMRIVKSDKGKSHAIWYVPRMDRIYVIPLDAAKADTVKRLMATGEKWGASHAGH